MTVSGPGGITSGTARAEAEGEMGDNRPLSELFEEVATRHANVKAAADTLEECRPALKAQKIQMLLESEPNMAVNRAENAVLANPDWHKYLLTMVETRKQANLLWVKVETLKMRHSEWQSQEANQRIQARL